jgi:hypothetical protein
VVEGGEGVVVWGCIIEVCFEYEPFGGLRGGNAERGWIMISCKEM